MYLKSLEIQGFKSFPDKTVLQFSGDITAIVGPNGSGKSNISDAIRWVMGEQSSKALRGAKMEDVIFGGTAKRSQLGFAEVSLVLDNTRGTFSVDAPDVMVTRRYYRSGESEYYINRQSARLRDVNELFMDTGLGREGYSNIGQGRIDEILSVKSQDRREIFEEAAGISKYRHRKEETERRLASAEENLLRIGDKISELELQVEPLRVQAEKAKQYLIYRDELRGLEVTVWLNTLEKLSETAQKAEEDYNSASFLLAQAHEDQESLYRSSEEFSASLRDYDLQTEEIRGQISELEQQEKTQEGQTAVLQARYENNLQNIERIHREMDDQQSRSDDLSAQITERETRIAEIREKLTQLQTALHDALENGRQLADSNEGLTRQLLEMRSSQADALSKAAEKKVTLSSISASLQAVHDRAKTAREDHEAALRRQQTVKTQAESCVKQLQAAQEEAVAAQNTISGYSLRMKARADKRDALQQKMAALRVELDTTEQRIRLFTEMEKEYEGFSRAVRTVMLEAERGNLKNIHAPVSRLLKTEDAYTLAIETALGGSMQSIVVSTDQDGKAAIQMLKRRDAGRATFLPISATRGRVLKEPELQHTPGVVGIAASLISCEAQYQEIFDNLLGRTVVAEDLDYAVPMAKKFGYRFRIVTLDGQVLNAGGSMTGGSSNKNAGILSRANELQRLQRVKIQLQTQQAQLQKELDEATRAAAETAYEITEAEGRLRQCQDDVLRLEGQQGQYQVLLNTLDAALGDFDRVLQEAAETDGRTAEQVRTLQAEITALEEQAAAAEARASALAESQNALQQKNQGITERITEIKMNAAAMEAEQTAAQDNILRLQALEVERAGDRDQKLMAIAEFEQANTAISEEIAQSQQKHAALQQQAAETRTALQQILTARMECESRRTQTEKLAQEKNKEIVQMERECARLEQKKASAAMEEKQILDKLWDSYELTHTTAQAVRQKIEDLPQANKRITELRRKISALGTPNLGAIEEFARVNERYQYLTGQRDDILTAKKELSEIVREITAEMTEIFRTEFRKIDEGFRATFAEMFGGGTAQLILEDENDVLGCGIEIRVQPPGKQLKTITLLSGGEKALVAIALYFAILKVRPTPFCMLDEIDAALDDRNVVRYASYLRNLSRDTQFIVITHRRGTMEEADVLYGVTMQEQGVSKMLSIDLNDMVRQLGIQA